MEFSQETVRDAVDGSPAGTIKKTSDRPVSARFEKAAQPGQDKALPPLSWNRLDLAIKLYFLESLVDSSSAFAGELYDAHLRAMEAKPVAGASKQARENMEAMLLNLQAGEQLPAGSPVALASDGTVLSGADMAAGAICLKHPIALQPTEAAPVTFDYTFFREQGLGGDMLDAAVLRFVEHATDVFVALLWPAAQGRDEEVQRIFEPVVYRKDVELNANGAHNLMTQVYAGEPWLGDPARNFPGVRNKMMPCFSRSGPLRIIIFQKSSLEEVLEAKQTVRDLFSVGKHSIHITDTHTEAIRVARLLLNDRSIHFLNTARPTRFPSTLRFAAEFESFLTRRNLPAERIAVDTGMVLAAYGLREAQDVDFVSPMDVKDEGVFSRHGVGAHQMSFGDLLHDPHHHFHFWGLKLVSLEQVARMKERRRVGRDIDDLRLIGPILAANSRHPGLRSMLNHMRFVVAKGRRRMINATKLLGVHGLLKTLQRRLSGRRA